MVDHGLDPALQACSDDFEGPSARNANLAAKSIIGIGAFAALCDKTGRECGGHYMQIARRYAKNWTWLASGGRGYGSNNNVSVRMALARERVTIANMPPNIIRNKIIQMGTGEK